MAHLLEELQLEQTILRDPGKSKVDMVLLLLGLRWGLSSAHPSQMANIETEHPLSRQSTKATLVMAPNSDSEKSKNWFSCYSRGQGLKQVQLKYLQNQWPYHWALETCPGHALSMFNLTARKRNFCTQKVRDAFSANAENTSKQGLLQAK